VLASYQKEGITIKDTNYYVPITIFNDTFSIMEAVVTYLKDHYNLKFSQIARLVGKNDRTVWTTYTRAKKK